MESSKKWYFHNWSSTITIDELIEMYEQKHDFDSLAPVQLEDRMVAGKLTNGLSSIVKGLKFLENLRFQRRVHFFG